MILAGDIGGTKTRLAFFDPADRALAIHNLEIFPSRSHGSLGEIVRKHAKNHNVAVESACFGIAGPVVDGKVETPNLPWTIDAKELAAEIDLPSVRLLNDLEASAHGIGVLNPDDFVILNEGKPETTGNVALISAGTGLGEAGLFRHDGEYEPFPSEGGHTDFAPRTELEVELLRYLIARFGHVSFERVLSGPGLHNIYTFLRDINRGTEPAWLADQMGQGDPSAVISKAALEKSSELCVAALDFFVSVYGSEAGNLALTVFATGGVFVGGGIAPKIIKKLKEPIFMESFVSKGRMRSLLSSTPVRVIMNEFTALLGAARVASTEVRGR